jgi:UDP-N-acetyl-2-amino-2-deoxyglucuronate dehydrogenase
MSETLIRAAIVGCGVIGRHHAAVLAAHPRFEVTALVDTSPAAAIDVAELISTQHAAPRPVVSTTLHAVLARADVAVDLVVVCTPSGTHIDIATEAVAAGLHTVVEKPLDVDIAKGRRFAALAADAAARGIHVSVISQHRFDPASLAVRKAVTDGRFGRLTSAVASVAWWRSQEYYDGGDWRGTWALDGGGAVMNQGVHTVDLLCWFLGRPIDVQAHTGLLAHERLEVEDTAVATVRFESGALAVVHATTAAFPGLAVRLQVHGSSGSAIIDNDLLEYFHAAQAAGAGNSAHGAGGVAGGSVSGNSAEAEVGFDETAAAPRRDDAFLVGHRRQYDNIAHSIDTGASPGVSVDEALLSIAVVRAIYLSSTLGHRVRIEDVLAGRYDSTPVQTGSFS